MPTVLPKHWHYPPFMYGTTTPPPTVVEVVTSLTNANTAADLTAAIAAGNQDAIELAAGDYTWQNIVVQTDRTARPLTIRPALGAAVNFVGPASSTGIIFQFGDGTHTPKWITLTGHDKIGTGSLTFKDFKLASSGCIEPRGSDHLTFTYLTFTNLQRDSGFAPNPFNSWCIYISGAGTGANTNLLIDHCIFNAPNVSRDISCIQIASSGSGHTVTITNIGTCTNYDYVFYDERPSTITINGWTGSNCGNHPTPASFRLTGAVNISGSISNVNFTASTDPYLDEHSGGGTVTTSNINIS